MFAINLDNCLMYSCNISTPTSLSIYIYILLALYWSIHIQIQKESPRFFPVLKALCIEHADLDNATKLNMQLTRVENNIQMILDRFENEVSTPANFLFLFVQLRMS